MIFNPLIAYVNYVMASPFGHLTPSYLGVNQYGPMMAVVLDRSGHFQTELFIIPESVQLIEYHRHPNVETFEMTITGDFIFESNGVKYQSSPEVVQYNKKNLIHVQETHVHGGLFKTAGAFITFQNWKNGVQPTSVGMDFSVDHLNENHMKGLKGLERKDKPVIPKG